MRESTDKGEQLTFFHGDPGAECLGLRLNACGETKWEEGEPVSGSYNPRGFVRHSIMFVQSGSAEMLYRGERWELSPGSLVVFTTGDKRGPVTIHGPWHEYWITYSGELPREAAEDVPRLPVQVALDSRPATMIRDLHHHASRDDRSTNHLAVMALQLLAELTLHAGPDASDLDLTPIHQIIRKVRSVPDLDWDFKKLAADHGISYSLLRLRMREVLGMPPHRFLNVERINLACAMLRRGRAVKAVTAAVGMKDPYHFSRLFKQITGMSPTEYAKKQD